MRKNKLWLLLVTVGLIFPLTACALKPTPAALAPAEATPALKSVEATPTPVPPIATPVPPTATPLPPTATQTPEPTPTLEPTVPAEDLVEKWRTLLYAALLTAATYDSLLKTADKLQAGEIDGIAAWGEIIAAGIFLKTVEDALAEWEPASDQMEYKTVIQDYVDVAQEVGGRWLDKEITSADVRGLLEDNYLASQDTLKSIKLAMEDDGLSPDAVASMLDELTQALETLETE